MLQLFLVCSSVCVRHLEATCNAERNQLLHSWAGELSKPLWYCQMQAYQHLKAAVDAEELVMQGASAKQAAFTEC